VIQVDEGSTVDLTAAPDASVLTGNGLTGPPPGNTPRIGWASGGFDTARITLGSSTQPTTRLTARSAGMAWVQASFLVGSAQSPYTFKVVLRPELDNPATVITKDQFDLIMNILNVLHPVGVEVNTAGIRSHVIEVQGDLAQANPDYTYPKFRIRGVPPPQVKATDHG
jgi:hypothetical protein